MKSFLFKIRLYYIKKHYIWSILKWIPILIIILLGCFIPTECFKFSNYINEVFFSIITALFITGFISTYNSIVNTVNLTKIVGYWLVLKEGDEFYEPDMRVVIIERTQDVLSLSYRLKDLNNVNEMKGKIFINENNKQTGKLITSFEWVDNTSTIYPTNEYSLFIDNDYFTYKKEVPLIRVMNLQGNEINTLIKPPDQKQIKQVYTKILNELSEKSATMLSEEIAELMLKSVSKK